MLALVPAVWAENAKPAEAAEDDRPNIVLLMAGDLSADMTGFGGNSEIRTPHLDRLAAESAWFSRCYTPTPQSAPAQATVLTGLYPHTHGVTADGATLSAYTDTLTGRLKSAGYTCGFVGRWNLAHEPLDAPGFGLTDYFATHDGRWIDAHTSVNGKTGQADKYLTDWEADQAIAFLDKHAEHPFFLWVSFQAPGEPLKPPPDAEQEYDAADLTLPDTIGVDRNTWPAKLKTAPPVKHFDEKKTDEKALLVDRAAYYAMVSRLDHNIGRILEHLDGAGLRKSTLVVFTSASGYALGEHDLLGKGPAFYEELVRVPLLIRYPGTTAAGAEIVRIVGLVDLAPTLLDAAGPRVPFTMQGDSLMGLLKDPRGIGHGDEEFFEYERHFNPTTQPGEPAEYACPVRGLITGHYKYIDYQDGSFVFYDLKRDPDEMQNLKNLMEAQPANRNYYKRNYEPVLKAMRERLTHWRKQTRDPSLK